MRAAETMTREVIVVPPDLTLARAWELMQKYRVRHLPVVQLGRLVGILSDRDVLVRSTLGSGQKLTVGPELVAEAMTPSPFTARRSATVSELAQRMLERRIDALPIIDAAERVVGLVTSVDLMELLVVPDEAKVLPFEFRTRQANAAGAVEAAASA